MYAHRDVWKYNKPIKYLKLVYLLSQSKEPFCLLFFQFLLSIGETSCQQKTDGAIQLADDVSYHLYQIRF